MESSSTISFGGLGQEVDPSTLVADPTRMVAAAPPIARPTSVREQESASLRIRNLSIRALNVVVSLALITLFLPVMAVIALAVKLTSAGPIIYSQERVGLDSRKRNRRRGASRPGTDRRSQDRGGRIFKINKFRTMTQSCPQTPQVWASKDDPRITPVGRFLRAHRLDELPQLFNVLRGDMNLVGPRPEQPEIFDELRKSIQLYPKRQAVRPGITGWAQVNHRYDENLDDVRKKLHLDLEYVRKRSLSKDVLIIAKTPSVMLFKQGSQ